MEHNNQELQEIFISKQQKYKRGKKLDLSGEPDTKTILFSPAKVVRCKAYQAEKEAIQAQKDKEKEARKVRAEANKLIKQQKAQEKAIHLAEAQKEKEVGGGMRPAKNPLITQANSTAPKTKNVTSKVPKFLPPSQSPINTGPPKKKSCRAVVTDPVVVESPGKVNSRGRSITLPKRFKST